MAAVRAQIGGAQAEAYPLSFNDIIAHVPGRAGRGDAKKGMYQNKNGNVLVVYSVNPQFVEVAPRANGRKTNRTGLTRTGMAIIDTRGKMRLITADREPDGKKEWKEFTGSITLSGNPHVVQAPAQTAHAAEAEDEEYEEEELE